MITNYKLKNNIAIASYRIPQLKSFHLRLSIKGGSLGENKSNNGLAHFMEHMLVQGIPSYPTAQLLSEYVEGLAGSYGAYTSSLTVSYSISVPETYMEEAIKIASEVFFQPLFPPEAIEKERNAVINEIKQKMDSRWYKFNQFFTQKRYTPECPLNIKTVGSIKAVETLTRDDLLNYWQKYFIPQNTYIVAEGNSDNEKLKQLLEKYFNVEKSQKATPQYPNLSNKELSKRLVAIREDKELKTNYIDFTFPGLTMNDSLIDRVKQNIALIILGRLRSSRLFKLLRYEKGLLYDVSTSDSQMPGLGFVNISAEVTTENLEEVINLITKTLKEFIQNGPTKEELKFTKNYIANSWLMSFDNPDSIADWIENQLLWKEKMLLPEDYIALIQDIKPEDIRKVVQSNWDLQKLNLVIQGPIKDSESNRGKYSKYIEELK